MNVDLRTVVDFGRIINCRGEQVDKQLETQVNKRRW
jgi:hypothetical protein